MRTLSALRLRAKLTMGRLHQYSRVNDIGSYERGLEIPEEAGARLIAVLDSWISELDLSILTAKDLERPWGETRLKLGV